MFMTWAAYALLTQSIAVTVIMVSRKEVPENPTPLAVGNTGWCLATIYLGLNGYLF
jgi:hypothetical protein